MEAGRQTTKTIQIFKFVTGEEIIATVEVDHVLGKEYISRPRSIVLKAQGTALGILLLPWLVSVGDNKFEINESAILARITERYIESDIIKLYTQEVSGITIANPGDIPTIKGI